MQDTNPFLSSQTDMSSLSAPEEDANPFMPQNPAQGNDSNPFLPQQSPQDSSWDTFVTTATKLAKQEGFPVNVALAQAALESSRGQAAPGNNYFGIKGAGNAGSNNLATQEADPSGNYYDTQSNFASYQSPQDSIQSYLNLVMSYPGVKEAIPKGPDAVIRAIKKAGYATSPSYVQSIENTPEFNSLPEIGGQQ